MRPARADLVAWIGDRSQPGGRRPGGRAIPFHRVDDVAVTVDDGVAHQTILMVRSAVMEAKAFVAEWCGFCPICATDVVFHADDPWFRDHLLCSGCGSIPRERAVMLVIE